MLLPPVSSAPMVVTEPVVLDKHVGNLRHAALIHVDCGIAKGCTVVEVVLVAWNRSPSTYAIVVPIA